MKKNEELILTIEDMSVDGFGIGRYEGMTFFVKDALIGDLARVGVTKLKKSYGYARLIELITPSPDRVEPVCAYHRQCGGCQLQALSYEKQLAFKQQKVENALRRIGGLEEIPMEPIVGMEEPFHYRNKAQFPVGTDRDGRIITGFYAGRTHHIVANRDCALGVPVNREILNLVIGYLDRCGIRAYDEATGEGLIRHVLIRYGFSTGEILVCLIVNGDALPREDELVRDLVAVEGMTSICLNTNRLQGNTILGDETRVLWGQGSITDQIGALRFQISPASFYQVNPVQTKVLYDLALEYAGLTGTETVWDLYCGIGTISLFLAQRAGRVYGVEISAQAVEDARSNAARNGIENVEFLEGKAEEIIPLLCGSDEEGLPLPSEKGEKEEIVKMRELGDEEDLLLPFKKGRQTELSERSGFRPDVVVVDPPRKGCDGKLLQTILSAAPERIVYVSCDPATLARDARILCEGGYRLVRVRPVDNFCQTVHVESVGLFLRE